MADAIVKDLACYLVERVGTTNFKKSNSSQPWQTIRKVWRSEWFGVWPPFPFDLAGP